MEANRKHLQEHDDGSDHHQLPDEILAHVLGCLPPSSLAAARCVRKHWCSLIDARRLLRADLLPLHLDAFFVNPTDLESRPSFFAPPSATRRITGLLDFSDTLKEFLYMDIRDHCNGLLLLADVVVNPATRQCSSLLPEFPEGLPIMTSIAGPMHPKCYLVYDPMVSPQHYEVFLIPSFPFYHPPNSKSTSLVEEELSAEWPPSPYTTHVFSSRKWRWEERSFVRQGEPAGIVMDVMRSDRGHGQAVYFRRALYVHCQNDSVMRIALLDDTYQMIKSPAAETKHFGEDSPLSYLGKSEKGVYYVLHHKWYGGYCRIWLLNELCGQMGWVLKSNIDLVEEIPLHHFANKYSKSWTVARYNQESPVQDEIDEWDFDDGIILKTTDNKSHKPRWLYAMVFLGFHPYKEIVFFCISSMALSYHLNTSKVQVLGSLHVTETERSFPYMACWESFENN